MEDGAREQYTDIIRPEASYHARLSLSLPLFLSPALDMVADSSEIIDEGASRSSKVERERAEDVCHCSPIVDLEFVNMIWYSKKHAMKTIIL